MLVDRANDHSLAGVSSPWLGNQWKTNVDGRLAPQVTGGPEPEGRQIFGSAQLVVGHLD